MQDFRLLGEEPFAGRTGLTPTSIWCRTRTFPQDIFTDRALDDIYKESTGIPRRINRICEKSLMYASQQGKRLIDEHLVRYIIEHEMLGGDV